MGRRITSVLAVALASIGVAGLAAAATADQEQVHHTAVGQAAARAVVLRRADLGGAPGWTGGPTKPNQGSNATCSSLDPKLSDLVEIGDAKTFWKNGPLNIQSEAQVLQTPAMVLHDWQREIVDPRVLPCLREIVAKDLPANARLVSARRLAFPAISTHSRAFRVVMDFTTSKGKLRVFSDVVLLLRGRTEITLTTSAPLADAQAMQTIQAAEWRLAVVMFTRVRM
jgi:hypothetical protein